MKKVLVFLCVFALSACLFGCGGTEGADSAGSGQAQNEAAAEEASFDGVEFDWAKNTVGIDVVSDDPDDIMSSNNDETVGKLVKVCFFYISDPENNGGFISESLFDNLSTYPIVLHDADGTTYEYTSSISDIAIKGGTGTEAFAMEELQPRFSITFDVPTDVALEDLTLDMGDGQTVALTSYTSAAYAADTANDEDDSSKS